MRSIALTLKAGPPGDSIGVFGPSGSGKTKLGLYHAGLMQLDKPASLSLALPNIGSPSEASFVPTDPFLMFSGIKTTVRGEFDLILQLTEIPLEVGRLAAANAITMLDIQGLLDRDPFTLSGGEAMRLAVALASVKTPRLMILDQIYDSLSADSATRIRVHLKAENVRGCTTVDLLNRVPPWCQDYDRWVELAPGDAPRIPAEKTAILEEAVASPCVRAERVYYQYKAPSPFALGPATIELRRGELLALVGPNGAGKTTLLKALARLVAPAEGQIWIEGSATELAAVERRLSRHWSRNFLYVFQNPDDQIYRANVEEELEETARHSGTDAIPERIRSVADQLGLTPVLKNNISDLPRPMRRLVTLGSSLVANARVLLLDEPTAGLDDKQCRLAGAAIRAYLDAGGSAIAVSHDMAFLEHHATRRISLEFGRISEAHEQHDQKTA